MLIFEDALEKLLACVPEARVVRVPLKEAWGRVLVSSIVADLDLPPFDKSFVDGYALRSKDVEAVPVKLQVIGTVAAGSQSQPSVTVGQAVQIMTGAAVPPGTDAVQMVEKTRRVASEVVEILEPIEKGKNMGPKGSEVGKGTVVLPPGRVVGPTEMGVLATFGYKDVEVYAAPTVAVVSTGDEIVDVGQRPKFGQIRNSNAYILWAQCHNLGVEVTVFPTIPDDPGRTRQAIAQGLEYDLVLFSGGVSVGEYDYVHQVLAQEGVDVFFHKAAIKPGKPILVGRKDEHMLFGLPGNPVSAYVTFELFVRPAIRRWMGFRTPSLRRVSGELGAKVRHKPGRKLFKPARTSWAQDRFKVEPIETKGSSDLVAFSPANSLVVVEADCTHLDAGRPVEVILLDRYFDA